MMRRSNLQHIGRWLIAFACAASSLAAPAALAEQDLDGQVRTVLRGAGFTGTIQAQFLPALGRPLDPQLADLGRLLWFDKSGGLHDDNTCGGCHSPSRAFGDTQSIAIGIQNNNVVGPDRKGPRNQRRTPFASNTPFYPNLMWNG
ncbi:MAG TPA: cytochrome c peroxidase, partial [Casimicrobiaceae bacterium]|nr:cytochrome c peroxidase [Casimicrobiaceae bacterium]